jgi:hypothetical protein
MPQTLEQPNTLQIPTRGCSVCGGKAFQVLPGNRNRRTETLECVHGLESWHRQAERLQLEIVATVSPSLKRLLTADLEQVLITRKNETV